MADKNVVDNSFDDKAIANYGAEALVISNCSRGETIAGWQNWLCHRSLLWAPEKATAAANTSKNSAGKAEQMRCAGKRSNAAHPDTPGAARNVWFGGRRKAPTVRSIDNRLITDLCGQIRKTDPPPEISRDLNGSAKARDWLGVRPVSQSLARVKSECLKV